MAEFEFEFRYFVFKKGDCEKYLTPHMQEMLFAIAARIEAGRAMDDKDVMESIVVERDWRCFDEAVALVKREYEEDQNDQV